MLEQSKSFLVITLLGVFALSAILGWVADAVLWTETLSILFLGVMVFAGSATAAVSAIPASARVVPKLGQEANANNSLLVHAMGPNITGVIGIVVATCVFLGMLE
ncbi:MAG: sodium ion-translocating decarboxylase subunit beta [Dehalococcoidia bacterium]|nr:sodium ion-translocating decarboxylase subunit beta [Dehalococcoidia bacterium]